jgi:hypothetical protein
MANPTFKAAALVAFAIAAAAGCGGGDDVATGKGAAGDAAASQPASGLTKAEFIERGDAICKKADVEQVKVFDAFIKENPGIQRTEAGQNEMVLIALPQIRAEAKELAALEAPSGDEDEIAALVAGIEKAVEQGEGKPSVLLGGAANPFDAVDRLADRYGFKVCNRAF